MAVKPAEGVAFEYNVPVVIIGAGACGLTAALAARDGGADVLVLERDAKPTGSTSLSAGLIPAANTRYQREKGIEDDARTFFNDLRAKAKGQSDPQIVMTVARASGETIDWLSEKHAIDFHLVEGFYYPGHSRLRMHGPASQTGADLEQALLVAVENAGIDVLTEASVEDVYAYADGRVTGVGFTRPDGAVETVGCDTLILACNGFGGNPEMVKTFIPEMSSADYCGHTSNTGDAVRWGEALGAALGDMASYQGHGSVAYPHGLPLTWAVITRGGFQVNIHGERFANEMRGYSEHAEEVIRQPQHIAWDIYDLHCEESALGFHDYREIVKLGAVKRADTIEELALLIEVPPAALKETLERTQACARGEEQDPFGRDFTKGSPLQAPFLACKVNGALFHTQGGLLIDEQAQVLKNDGSPLPNLFAGGGAARGLSGPSSWGYMSGNGLLAAAVLGRIAGQSAARLARAS
ncbi:FAD-dependent oxidoreductase [Limoniibacter endophyticus]|uniref:Fumarate reductase flavoprotein subunit n=1 Tax=Limoniibacter endophyticus TaxID=1565040 RepID=A0A8J3GGL6_9HYPH|nr:FAD-dependent oxidoreductase [Limoniibacter endophyticus]GHC66326.1 fumarate reductase flavoprotein subunit [Limoniibacter endophyticus]